jgi:hypothetical protein
MSGHSVSRRAMLGYAGAGAAGASVSGRAAAVEGALARPPGTTARLLEPLQPGASLGHWRIERLIEPEGGAASVVLSDPRGQHFQLDLCARDASAFARRGPAVTEHFEIFLANRGDGSTDTNEDHGLAAMALGEVIRANEAHADLSAFLTLAERNDARRHVR